MTNLGTLYIVSAPSGAGKTSLLKALSSRVENISFSTSTTTRAKRPSEVDGIDYHFVSVTEFQSMIEQGGFLEHAEVFGNFYGTAKTHINEVLNSGNDLVLEIDWQGAQQIRNKLSDTLSIFILPPSRNELAYRLKGRAQDDEQVIKNRMSAAIEEISHYKEYDYLIINDIFEAALENLENIIRVNRLTLSRQSAQYNQLISELM